MRLKLFIATILVLAAVSAGVYFVRRPGPPATETHA